MVNSSKRDVQSLVRGLDILTLLARSDRPMGVTEIAQTFGLDKSTAFRLLSTLVNSGFVIQEDATRQYRAGFGIVELGSRILDHIELRSVAKPWLNQLQRVVDESAHLAQFVDGRVVYIDSEESAAGLNVNARIGQEAPVHCTATGKALIAFLSPVELEQLLGYKQLTRYTPKTIISNDQLLGHLESVCEKGYAVDDEEYIPGVRCIAAPVYDHRGKVVASVGISGPSIRVSVESVPKIAAHVLETASRISQMIGHLKQAGQPSGQ